MRGIIWYYSDVGAGMARFQKLVDEYDRVGIANHGGRVWSEGASIEFDNGDFWVMCSSKTSARGHACNVSLIERCTPEDVVRYKILPTLKSPPYQAYMYYGD